MSKRKRPKRKDLLDELLETDENCLETFQKSFTNNHFYLAKTNTCKGCGKETKQEDIGFAMMTTCVNNDCKFVLIEKKR